MAGVRKTRNTFFVTILIGFSVSISLELLQFYSARGLTEFDDVFHNTLGTAAGALVGLGVIALWRNYRQN